MRAEIAAAFLAALDPVSDQHLFVALDDQKPQRDPIHWFGRLADHWSEIVDANLSGYGIFVTVNRVGGPSRKASDVTGIRAVWRDNDGDGSAIALPLPPHIVVHSSPGKTHEYWLADCDASHHKRICRAIAAKFGGDRRATDLSRVLRLPGTLHTKGAPHLVTCEIDQARVAWGPYNEPELIEAFGPLAPEAYEKAAPEVPLDLTAVRAALDVVPAGDRDTWFTVGAALHNATFGASEGLALFDEWSQRAANYGGVEKLWNSFTPRADGIKLGSLFKLARAHGYTGPTGDTLPGIEAVPSAPAISFGAQVFRARDNRAAIYEPHKWVCDDYALRKTVSLIVAQPGVGKSTLALHIAVSVALGDGSLYGVTVREKCPVLVVSAEDSREFVEPRVAGVVEHLRGKEWPDADIDAAREDVHIYAEPFRAMIRAGRELRRTEIVQGMVDYVRANRIGFVILDPLVETHEGDENNNSEIRQVVSMYREVAVETGCAVLIVHHGRKPGQNAESMAGDLSSARGAGSLAGAVRAAVTLTTMSGKEATSYGVAEADRFSYFRADGAKNSHGRMRGNVWYRKESQRLSGGLETPICTPLDLTPIKTTDAQRQIEAVADLIPAEETSVGAFVKTWLNDDRGAHLTTRKARDTLLAALADDALPTAAGVIRVRRSATGQGGTMWREPV
jgi:KaiC/GvpD/RAD55 family RecA-like ATPase